MFKIEHKGVVLYPEYIPENNIFSGVVHLGEYQTSCISGKNPKELLDGLKGAVAIYEEDHGPIKAGVQRKIIGKRILASLLERV